MDPNIQLSPSDAAAVAEFRDAVRAELGENFVELRLFASRLTGRDTPVSDIDVLVNVRCTDYHLENRIVDLAFFIGGRHEVFISTVIFDEAYVEHEVWRHLPFLRAARAGGELL